MGKLYPFFYDENDSGLNNFYFKYDKRMKNNEFEIKKRQ